MAGISCAARRAASSAWIAQDAFIGRQSQRVAFKAGEGEIGIENQGLNRWGMSFVKGKPL